MLLVTGVIDRMIQREAGNPGNTWTETTLVVKDWGQSLYVTVGRDFGDLPAEGESVALDTSVRAYVSKKNAGEAGHSFTAHRRNVESERALYGERAALKTA